VGTIDRNFSTPASLVEKLGSEYWLLQNFAPLKVVKIADISLPTCGCEGCSMEIRRQVELNRRSGNAGDPDRTVRSYSASIHPARKIWRWRERLILLCQLLATTAVLGWVPGNVAKLLTMIMIWVVGFRRVSAAEFLMMAGVNLFFAVMNAAALARGIFRFDHPDFLGMPVYEYLMWGFYTLHTIRFLGGPPPRDKRIAAPLAAVVFALPFATIADPVLLLLASATVLSACLVLFRERMDWAYAAYMAGLGALIEYVGVATGQWHYPNQPYGGVPLWFITMWAGVGLFARRLILPLVHRVSRDDFGHPPGEAVTPSP
jgi:hypothetical protein